MERRFAYNEPSYYGPGAARFTLQVREGCLTKRRGHGQDISPQSEMPVGQFADYARHVGVAGVHLVNHQEVAG